MRAFSSSARGVNFSASGRVGADELQIWIAMGVDVMPMELGCGLFVEPGGQLALSSSSGVITRRRPWRFTSVSYF